VSGAVHPLPQYVFKAWRLVKAQAKLYLYLIANNTFSLDLHIRWKDRIKDVHCLISNQTAHK